MSLQLVACPAVDILTPNDSTNSAFDIAYHPIAHDLDGHTENGTKVVALFRAGSDRVIGLMERGHQGRGAREAAATLSTCLGGSGGRPRTCDIWPDVCQRGDWWHNWDMSQG